ncbi:MAG: hypothetical protein ACUVWR_04115 [Anaerolineae bacterium]
MVGKMRITALALLLLVSLGLASCAVSQPSPTAVSSPSVPSGASMQTPSPIPSPSATATTAPTAVMTTASMPLSPLPTPTPTLVPPYATPHWEAYQGTPFTIVFVRNLRELWLSRIGGSGERLLASEKDGREIAVYTIAPDGRTIAYISGGQYAAITGYGDTLKLLDIESGEIREVARAEKPQQLFMPGWCGPDELTYYVVNPIKPLQPGDPESGKLISYVRLDPATGERNEEETSTIHRCSPNGRYILFGQYFWPPYFKPESVPYELLDTETGERWAVIEASERARFEAWSPDGKFMLFSLLPDPDFASLMVVNIETRTRKVITPPDEAAAAPAWAPDGGTIAYEECGAYLSGCGCPELWLTSPDGENRRKVLMGEKLACQGESKATAPLVDVIYAVYDMSWTLDGKRLVFSAAHNFPIHEDIWSVRVDGTDLRPLAQGRSPRVLPSP